MHECSSPGLQVREGSARRHLKLPSRTRDMKLLEPVAGSGCHRGERGHGGEGQQRTRLGDGGYTQMEGRATLATSSEQ